MTTRLSSDLITEVLSRLPPKSLLRFRCASKSLCSEIDGPEFVNLHLRRSVESGSHHALTFGSKGQVHLYEHFPDFTSSPKDLSSQVRPLSANPVRFVGSCNGLIALALEGGVVVIWNPFTRNRWIVPVPDDFHFGWSLIGFGYDSLSDDYKVVKVDERYNKSEYHFKARVYSFKSNTWKPISKPPNSNGGSIPKQRSVLAHEMVHFVRVTHMQNYEIEVYIKALDLHTEKFWVLEVKLPAHQNGGPATLDLTVLGSHFSIVRWSGERHSVSTEMEAWVLKDYGRKEESLTKLFQIFLPWYPNVPSKSLLESRNMIILHCPRNGFARIDLESLSVEKVKVKRICGMKEASLLVPCIVSLGVGIADNTGECEDRAGDESVSRTAIKLI